MARKNRTQEENARREKIRGLLQMANIDSMDNIQNLFKETIAEFMEKGLEAELDEELDYSKYDYKNKDTDNSRKLSTLELLHHARMEWSVEVMHWLLDVHFGEDFCRVEDKNVQQNLNLLRKFAISSVKQYKSVKKSKRPMSNIMFECLLDPLRISDLLNQN